MGILLFLRFGLRRCGAPRPPDVSHPPSFAGKGAGVKVGGHAAYTYNIYIITHIYIYMWLYIYICDYIYIYIYIYVYGWINRYRNIVDDNDISLVYTVYIMSINDVHDTWLFIHIRSRPSIPNWAHICLKIYAHILNGIWDWGTKKISTPPGVVEDGAAQTWMKNSPVVGFKGVAQPPTSDA